jgi:hypothetical protein
MQHALSPAALPPPIAAYAEGSFAHFTVKRRLPKILADVIAELDEGGRADPRWSDLRSAIVDGGEIDLRLLSGSTPFWQRRLAALAGQRWSEQSFFDLEFLFYHAINSIALDLLPGFDVFASVRRAALFAALPRVASVLESTEDLALEPALLLAVTGNESDLSQIARDYPGVGGGTMLKDERRNLTARLGAGSGTVHLIADNAGAELCFDLVLVDVLLAARLGPVAMHVKPWPMFVSDALIADVEETIDSFCKHDTGSRLAAAGQRLQQAVREGALVLHNDADWGEPRHMDALEPDLAASLRAGNLVLAKGDLNYRRFFADRAWPADTSVKEASVAGGMHAFALRVLKSDSIVGLDSPQVAHLHAVDPGWRSNGKYSILQRVDKED